MKPASVDMPLLDAMFPFARRGEYFLLFGRRGLAEYQVLVANQAIEGFLTELQRQALAQKPPGVLVSMKLFRGDPCLLRFEGDGVCITLNVARSPAGLKFLSFMDELTTAFEAIPHIIKDSRLPADVVRKCYPEYDMFRERLRAQDPDRVFRSELSGRLGL